MNNKRISRPKTRRFLFQYLYAISFGETSKDTFLESFFNDAYIDRIDWDYFREMCKWIVEKESSLIYIVKKYAPRYDISKMHMEYLLPVFIAAYEMLYLKEELPYKVSINEAIELTKVFSDDSSRKFVNGVLNNVAKEHKELFEEVKEIKTEKNNLFKITEIN